MRSHLTHDLQAEREQIVSHRSGSGVAIVDLGSYPAFVAEGFDRFDLMQHLCRQTEALTAMMWEVPDMLLNLQLILSQDPHAVEDLAASGHRVVAGGAVRSFGQLCLASHESLLDCAGHRHRDLLRHRRRADELSPRLLLVPSGVYEVTVFSGPTPWRWTGEGSRASNPDYIVVLRHFPHPAPRLQPVRLAGLAIAGF